MSGEAFPNRDNQRDVLDLLRIYIRAIEYGRPTNRQVLYRAADEIERLRVALQMACEHAWTDGESAARGYIDAAREVLDG